MDGLRAGPQMSGIFRDGHLFSHLQLACTSAARLRLFMSNLQRFDRKPVDGIQFSPLCKEFRFPGRARFAAASPVARGLIAR
jgi:hypothetical protein